jgi:hypothetical protein
MHRRDVLLSSLTAFAAYALLREAHAAVPNNARMPARRWIARQDELARGLADGSVSQVQWHEAVNGLAREVDTAGLGAEIRRAKLRDTGAPFGHDPVKRFVTFMGEDGKPARVAYGAALFTFTRDSVITPHAHKHMASAHLVIDGKVRIRTFDRIGDRVAEAANAIVVRPTRDEIAGPGHAAAMTTMRDNVHWFAARSETAMTFDVIIDGLDPGEKPYLIQPVDILGGERRRRDGTIRAPILSFAESSARYSVDM